MGSNDQTHIFQSTESLMAGYREAISRATEGLRNENMSLLRRLGSVMTLMGIAHDALNDGRLSKAREYLKLAEECARAGN